MERINEKLKEDIIQGASKAENSALNSLQECRELIASSSEVDEALIEQIKAKRKETLEQLNNDKRILDVFKNGYDNIYGIDNTYLAKNIIFRCRYALGSVIITSFVSAAVPDIASPAVVASGGFLAMLINWGNIDNKYKIEIDNDSRIVCNIMDSLSIFVDAFEKDEKEAIRRLDAIKTMPNSENKKDDLLQVMDNTIELLHRKKDTKDTLEDELKAFVDNPNGIINLVAQGLDKGVEKEPQSLESLLLSIVNSESTIIHNLRGIANYCYEKGSIYRSNYLNPLLARKKETSRKELPISPQELSANMQGYCNPQYDIYTGYKIPFTHIKQDEFDFPLQEALLLESFDDALADFIELTDYIESEFKGLNLEINKVISKNITPEAKAKEIKRLVRSLIKQLEHAHVNKHPKKQVKKVIYN